MPIVTGNTPLKPPSLSVSTAPGHSAPAACHRPSRWDRFWASYVWLISKNILGWALILTSFILGPFVPGPGGIPMFLIGFALITFPGKRHLTARVLRGRPFHIWSLRTMLFSVAVACAAPGLALWTFSVRGDWLDGVYNRGPLAIVGVYLAGVVIAWLVAIAVLQGWNLFVRIVPRIRRRVRPWLRRRHIRLLPPRWRCPHPHERGGTKSAHPVRRRIRVGDEILAFLRSKKPRRQRPKA